MKKNNLIKVILSCSIALAFAGGGILFVQSQLKPQEVYKFSRNIPVNTVIQDGDLTKDVIPKSAVTADMITNKDDVLGKAVVNKSFAEQYIIKSQLVEPENVDPFEEMDLTNYRKVSISISSKDAIGGNIKRGDTVDLLAIRQGEHSGDAAVESKIFMQNVLVYNVIDEAGRKYFDQTEGTDAIMNGNGEAAESGNLSIVTLAVTAEQAEEIEARKTVGEFKIVGRFDDSANVTTSGKVIYSDKL